MGDRLSWCDRPTDAFGRLLVDPCQLEQAERIACLRRDAGRLLASPNAGYRLIGRGVLSWLDGMPAEDAFGVRPPRGSRSTVKALARRLERDHALLALAAAVGCDRLALRLLRAEVPCPPEHGDLLAEAQRLGCPSSRNAVTRARERITTAGR